ncbi:MAG: putative metal-binding motif-containing protein [Bacteroidetes bacterium]|nr:putative metal-binding motif-containing protein [Bacteroidota bacterium]
MILIVIDVSATIYPGAVEICNGIDDDCNGTR